MADSDTSTYASHTAAPTGGQPPKRNWQPLINWTGAASSLALVVGLGVWGYKLMVRDVSGVPVVRALEGPMRVAPEDPGGMQAEHQGLAVNGVAADGGAAGPSDRLVLAPRPVDVTDEDTAMAAVPPVVETEPEPAPEPVSAPPQVQAVTDPDAPGAITAPDPVDATLALADRIAADAEPLSDLAPPTSQAPLSIDTDMAAASPALVLPAAYTGRRVSMRPVARPASSDLAVRAALAAAQASVDESTPQEVVASAVPLGTNLVQLGAYDSAEVARKEWDRLNRRFASLLSDKRRVVQETSRGGKIFFRLRAMGFADAADARRFCDALRAENAECITAVAR